MNTLLVVTLISNIICVIYTNDTNIFITDSRIKSMDVFGAASLNDGLADLLFPVYYPNVPLSNDNNIEYFNIQYQKG